MPIARGIGGRTKSRAVARSAQLARTWLMVFAGSWELRFPMSSQTWQRMFSNARIMKGEHVQLRRTMKQTCCCDLQTESSPKVLLEMQRCRWLKPVSRNIGWKFLDLPAP